jgi:hypothetical protein
VNGGQFVVKTVNSEERAEGEKMDDSPKNKQEALIVMAREREVLEKTLEGLSDAQLTSPGKDGWSIKDHLMHIAVWEQGIVALLNKQSRYAAMGLSRDEWRIEYPDFDNKTNALIHERTKSRTLAEVRAAFHDSHQQMLDVLARLTEDDLLKPYSHYAPDEPDDGDKRPAFAWIAGNTYGHYAEHREWIQELIDKRG